MSISYISHVDINLDMLTKVTLNHTVQIISTSIPNYSVLLYEKLYLYIEII